MKVKAENVISIAESSVQIRCPKGALQKLADSFGCSTKTVSRAIHGTTGQASRDNYISIRAAALRYHEGETYEVRRLHL